MDNNFLVTIPALNGSNEQTTVRRMLPEELQDTAAHKEYQELGLDKYSGDPLPIDKWDVVRRNTVDAIATSDHIQICSYLKAYAESDETITSQELRDFLGENAPTRTGCVYDRFKFIWCGTIGKGKSKQKTWFVEHFNPVKERLLKSPKG
ncbi:MAG: hypothetical protein ACRC1Z_06990 [Waterburya sp.]